MSFEVPSAAALDYLPCRYGESRLLFRGPRRKLGEPYVAFLGGTETYGKYVANPFPSLLEAASGRTCLNLGCVNAGLDSFVKDPDVLRLGRDSDLCVVQVLGAQNLSNRFYRVHPRRNDRFLEASPLMAAIYREVDFTEFHFNKHMLSKLYMLSPDRFESVREELRQAWLGRMRLLLQQLGKHTLLLWLRMDTDAKGGKASPLGTEPLMITAEMIDALRDQVCDVVELKLKTAEASEELDGMVYGPLEAPAAAQMPGQETHRKIAEALMPVLQAHA